MCYIYVFVRQWYVTFVQRRIEDVELLLVKFITITSKFRPVVIIALNIYIFHICFSSVPLTVVVQSRTPAIFSDFFQSSVSTVLGYVNVVWYRLRAGCDRSRVVLLIDAKTIKNLYEYEIQSSLSAKAVTRGVFGC